MPYRASQDTQFIGAFGELTAAEELRVQEIQALSDTAADEALGKLSGSVVKKAVAGGDNYTLPTATDSILGGVKVGTGLEIADGVLSATATGGGISWNNVTGTTQSAAVDNGYIANNAGLVTITLPATATVGAIVKIAGAGAGGWKLAQNASQIIHFGNKDTTTGTGGYLASNDINDGIAIVCSVENTGWVVTESQGNITIV